MAKKKISVVAHCSQPPIFEFEGFIVRPLDELSLFFENAEGEGTQISRVVFLRALERLFKETM